MVLNSLGGVLQRLGKFSEAADVLQQSAELEDRIGNVRGRGMVLNSLGGVLQRLGKFDDAADALRRSLTISEQLKDERSLAMVLNSLGGVLQRLGKFDDAADALRRSHELLKAQGDERGQAMVLNSLGGVLQRLGSIEDSDAAFQHSIEIGERLRDNRHLAKARTAFGKALVTRGVFPAALEHLRVGFGLDLVAGSAQGLSIVAPILVDTLRRTGASVEASDVIRRALAVAPLNTANSNSTLCIATRAGDAGAAGRIGAARAPQRAALMHGHAAAVVAAVLQALQALEQDGNDVAVADRADDAAHGGCPETLGWRMLEQALR